MSDLIENLAYIEEQLASWPSRLAPPQIELSRIEGQPGQWMAMFMADDLPIPVVGSGTSLEVAIADLCSVIKETIKTYKNGRRKKTRG